MNSILVNQNSVIPSKIVCVGRNYSEHIVELGNAIPDNMVLFSKPNSAISRTLHSFHQEPLHYEGELCFLIKKGSIRAVGFGLDLTKRQLQKDLKSKGLPWERAKAFDGSAVFSQFVEIMELPDSLSFTLTINQQLAQEGHSHQMLHSPNQILDEINSFMSLNDGDIVMTGTPKGVGQVNSGDVFNAQVLSNNKVLIESNWVAV